MSFLRSIEKAIRRSTLRIIGRSGVRGPDDAMQALLPQRPRILLIRIDRIGDAIISTPVLNSLRERFPEGRIDILLGEKNRAIAPLLPGVDNVLVLSKKNSHAIRTIKELRRTRYHAVVNLHLNKSASASVVSRLAGGDVVIESPQENAFAGSGGTFDHVVTMTARLLKPFGIESIDERNERNHPLRLRLPVESTERAAKLLNDLLKGEEEREKILINVSTTHVSRNWLTEHFIELAVRLRAEGSIPMICGGPADSERVEEIALAGNALMIPPLTRYADFAAVVARADIVITPDTSTVHLAAALGRPAIVLTASERTARTWRPWGVPYRTLADAKGMEMILPASVVAALRGLPRINTEQQPERTEIPTRFV